MIDNAIRLSQRRKFLLKKKKHLKDRDTYIDFFLNSLRVGSVSLQAVPVKGQVDAGKCGFHPVLSLLYLVEKLQPQMSGMAFNQRECK